MKAIFQWSPLKPPTEGCSAEGAVANGVALAGGLLGFVMVGLGLDAGLTLYLPMLLSAFLFGLPHGAIDHLVLLGLANQRMTFKSLMVTCLAYLAVVGLVLLLWWALPMLALILFLGITIYHWGRADLAYEGCLNPDSAQSTPKWLRWNHAVLRGFFPIGLPFLSFPEATGAILNACTLTFGNPYVLGSLIPTGCLLGGLSLLPGEILYLQRQPHTRLVRITEDLALLAFFCLVPPVLAIGLYFCLWHGLRHVLRLMRYDDGNPSLPRLSGRLKRFYHRAWPFTLASILIVAALHGFLIKQNDPAHLLGLYLVVISALTAPHLLVVEWMDRREGV